MKFNHILFPVDFSERSRALNRQVEWLATRFTSLVTLLHVFEIPATWYAAAEASYLTTTSFNALRESMQKRLDEYPLKVPDMRVERLLSDGNAAENIINFAHEHEVDIIMMGAHGYGALQGWLIGSVTEKVLHRANCPVWTDSLRHPQPEGLSISRILCAVEMIDEAIPMLRFTDQLAHDLNATVRLVHSVPESEPAPNRYLDFDLHRYLMEAARVELAKMQREAGTDFPVTISGFGVSRALAEAGGEYGADLIVTGRGHSQKSLGIFHTHIYNVVRHAPCPVLSYPATQPDRTSSSCIEEHPGRSAADGPLLIGSPTS